MHARRRCDKKVVATTKASQKWARTRYCLWQVWHTLHAHALASRSQGARCYKRTPSILCRQLTPIHVHTYRHTHKRTSQQPCPALATISTLHEHQMRAHKDVRVHAHQHTRMLHFDPALPQLHSAPLWPLYSFDLRLYPCSQASPYCRAQPHMAAAPMLSLHECVHACAYVCKCVCVPLAIKSLLTFF